MVSSRWQSTLSGSCPGHFNSGATARLRDSRRVQWRRIRNRPGAGRLVSEIVTNEAPITDIASYRPAKPIHGWFGDLTSRNDVGGWRDRNMARSCHVTTISVASATVQGSLRPEANFATCVDGIRLERIILAFRQVGRWQACVRDLTRGRTPHRARCENTAKRPDSVFCAV